MKPKIPRGWRRLGPREYRRGDDMFFNELTEEWTLTEMTGWMVGNLLVIRRKSARSPSKRKGESK